MPPKKEIPIGIEHESCGHVDIGITATAAAFDLPPEEGSPFAKSVIHAGPPSALRLHPGETIHYPIDSFRVAKAADSL